MTTPPVAEETCVPLPEPGGGTVMTGRETCVPLPEEPGGGTLMTGRVVEAKGVTLGDASGVAVRARGDGSVLGRAGE